MGCSSSKNLTPGDNFECQPAHIQDALPTPTTTSPCNHFPFSEEIPAVRKGILGSQRNTNQLRRKLEVQFSSVVSTRTPSCNTSLDGSDETFSASAALSLGVNILIEIPDDFSRKYKILSIISEKQIESFAFRGIEFRGGDADIGAKVIKSESDDDCCALISSSKEEAPVVLHKAINRNQKYVIVERTKIDKFLNSTIQIEYFDRIDLLRSIDHPCVPSILDVFDTPTDYTIVLQYSVGKSLSELLKSRGRMNNKMAVKKLVLTLINTLEYLHGMNIAHRNIDTEHLILSRYNHFGRARDLKVSGLSRLTYVPPSSRRGLSSLSDTLPVTTVSAVQKQYLNIFSAPELCQPNHGLEVDLYSFGVTLYFLFGGDLFSSNIGDEVKTMNIDELPVATELKRIIKLLVSKEPSERCSLLNVKSYFVEKF